MTKINLVRIAFVRYLRKDVETQHKFLLDFGMEVAQKTDDKIYYRGYGDQPFIYTLEKADEDAFGGAGFAVESLKDLEYASSNLPNASEVYSLTDAPGGGKAVKFLEPVDNCPWFLVHGQELRAATDNLPERDYNFPLDKHRSVNKTQRFKKEPSPIHKLGHFGLCLTDYTKAYEFYTTHFNLIPSDIVYDDEKDVTVFLRLDRGNDPVDHHTFFFFQGPKFHVHHSSFEVHDFDTQLLGHDWLQEQGYENCWGVGRHVMGSQIFDYWFDPFKFIVEHYSDGDLFDSSVPPNRTKAGPGNLHIWGPEVPATFVQ